MAPKKSSVLFNKALKPNHIFDEYREQMHHQMLSAVSHDLKTPLATIIGSLEIYNRMEERLTPEKKHTLIHSALGEAYRLDHFITNILDIARLESGMVKVKIETCNLATLLQDSITRLGTKSAKGTLQLHCSSGESRVETDPFLLGRAASIVLDNALKHAGKTPRIFIEYGARDGQGYIHVRDNGLGVDIKRQEEIFSKYTRFSTRDQQNAGTGLGLAICRLMMGLISGSVTMRNLPEGGAEFSLLFPSA